MAVCHACMCLTVLGFVNVTNDGVFGLKEPFMSRPCPMLMKSIADGVARNEAFGGVTWMLPLSQPTSNPCMSRLSAMFSRFTVARSLDLSARSKVREA